MGDRKARFKVVIGKFSPKKASGTINNKPFKSTLKMHHITPKWSHRVQDKMASSTEAATLTGFLTKREREEMLLDLNKDLNWTW